MSDNVVGIPTKSNMLWVCECGCRTFYLVGDGSTECAACDAVVSDDQGGWSPPKSVARWDGPEPFADVQGNNSEEFARRRISNLANEADVVALVVVREGGTTHTWSSAESVDRVEWVERRILEAADLISQRFGARDDD